MSKIVKVETACCICKTVSTQTCVLSSSAFGSIDLDTRSPKPDRLLLFCKVQSCPNCKYCSSEIFKENLNTKIFIKTKEYIEQFNNKNFPKLTNEFLCYSLILEKNYNYCNAAFNALYAAWSCDDEKLIKSAKICRIKAIKLFLSARQNEQSFANSIYEEDLLLVDLYRRSCWSRITMQISAAP